MRERRIRTDLGTLAVYEQGDGPAALLWPSLYTDHRSLSPLVERLASARRCITLDGPGHGRSAVPDKLYSLDDCVCAARQILDELAIDQVDWIGSAWGGHVGVCMSVDSPARVRTLTVIASPMSSLPVVTRMKLRAALGLLSLGARELFGKLIAQTLISPSSGGVHREYVQDCIREAPAGGIRQAVLSISLGRPDLRSQLPRIRVPTLFIAGSDDPIWPPAAARTQAARVPGARFEVVSSSSHLPPIERPGETAALVQDFLGSRWAIPVENSGKRPRTDAAS